MEAERGEEVDEWSAEAIAAKMRERTKRQFGMDEYEFNEPRVPDEVLDALRKHTHPWTGAIVARDKNYTGGIGRVISEPGDDGVAWVYWGTGDNGKFETREVVAELVSLDLNEDFMANYKRSEDSE